MADMGHNSQLTDKERRALRMHHIRLVQAAEAKVAEARAVKTQLRTEAKKDGFKKLEIDAGVRLLELDDESIFIDEIRELYGIAEDFGILPKDQADLFQDRRPIEERAYDEGLAAALAGRDRNAPYGVDSGAGQEWLRGWDDGQAEMRDQLQSAMEKKNAALEAEEAEFEPELDETTDEEWNNAAPQEPPQPPASA